MKRFLSSQRLRRGSLATAITLAGLAFIVVCNILVSTLAERQSWRLDLTANQAFALTADSLAFLQALEKDVAIYVLEAEDQFTLRGEYFTQANEVIRQYARQSGRITLEYVDVQLDPTFVTRFPELQLGTASIVLACGERSMTVSPYDLFNIEQSMYGGYITSSMAEQTMTSALLYITSEKRLIVSVLSGYGEAGLDAFLPILELNNYQIVRQNILTEDINPEAVAAIVACPERDWQPGDLKKLDTFLENGGKKGKTLLYFTSAVQADTMPNLAAFLRGWGIAPNSGVVMETNNRNYIYGSPLNPLAFYTEGVYAARSLERDLPVTVPLAKPLEVVATDSISISVPLQFSETCVVCPPGAGENWTPADATSTGPFPAIVLATDTRGGEGRSHVAAVASITALDETVLNHTSLANAQYFLDLLDALTERGDAVRIQPKTLGGEQLGLNEFQVLLLAGLSLVVAPLLVLAAGVAVWLRRRHL